MTSKRAVFVGCNEIAGLMNQYSRAIRESGFTVRTLVFKKNPYYQTFDYYDRVLEQDVVSLFIRNKLPKFISDKVQALYFQFAAWRYMKRIVNSTDIFLFVGGSFNLYSWDLKYLKRRGKKIIYVNCGSEVRNVEAFCQEFALNINEWKGYLPKDSLEDKILYLRKIEESADLIFSVPDQSGLALRPYFHLKLPMQFNDVKENIPLRRVPIVVHCPTKKDLKGTAIIEATLNKLRNDGVEFDYQRVENQPNEKVLGILSEADIVVDELNFPGPGVLGMEAMSAGCVECTRHIPNKDAGWNPPVVNITTQSIYCELKKVITDLKYRSELASGGRKYVEKNHLPNILTTEMLSLLESPDLHPHYYPRFYLESFIQKRHPSKKIMRSNRDVLLKVGCDPSADINKAIADGLLPPMSVGEIARIPRWSRE